MKKKKDIFNHIEADKLNNNFTKNVMKDIYALENEKALGKIIQTKSELEVSDDFTQKVIQKIDISLVKKKRRKILTRKEKFLFFLTPALLIIIHTLFTKENQFHYLDKFNFSFIEKLNFEYFSLITTIFVCISLLLMIDFIINKNRLSQV